MERALRLLVLSQWLWSVDSKAIRSEPPARVEPVQHEDHHADDYDADPVPGKKGSHSAEADAESVTRAKQKQKSEFGMDLESAPGAWASPGHSALQSPVPPAEEFPEQLYALARAHANAEEEAKRSSDYPFEKCGSQQMMTDYVDKRNVTVDGCWMHSRNPPEFCNAAFVHRGPPEAGHCYRCFYFKVPILVLNSVGGAGGEGQPGTLPNLCVSATMPCQCDESMREAFQAQKTAHESPESPDNFNPPVPQETEGSLEAQMQAAQESQREKEKEATEAAAAGLSGDPNMHDHLQAAMGGGTAPVAGALGDGMQHLSAKKVNKTAAAVVSAGNSSAAINATRESPASKESPQRNLVKAVGRHEVEVSPTGVVGNKA